MLNAAPAVRDEQAGITLTARLREVSSREYIPGR
jgi:hypothetical protein